MIDTWSLERKKLELEIKKTQLEVEKLEREAPHETRPGQKQLEFDREDSRRRDKEIRAIDRQLSLPGTARRTGEATPELALFEGRLFERKASNQIFSVVERLGTSPIRIEDVEVKLVDEEEQ